LVERTFIHFWLEGGDIDQVEGQGLRSPLISSHVIECHILSIDMQYQCTLYNIYIYLV